jgi:membrane fusion protein (multidrug efflux system)
MESARNRVFQLHLGELKIMPWVGRLSVFAAAAALLVLVAYQGSRALQYFSSHEETDDAYVTAHLHQISTRVNGTVEKVLVDDNEHVKKGQVLFVLDPSDYQVKAAQALASLKQAERSASAAQVSIDFQGTSAHGEETNAQGLTDNALAAITRSQAEVREAQANIEVARANLAAKEAELARAATDYARFENLEREGAISTSQRDSAKRDYLVAMENTNSARNAITQATERLEQAKQSVIESKAQFTKAQAQVQLAKASNVQTHVIERKYETELAAVSTAAALLKEAELNLSYTKIVAPIDGRVGKKTVEEGQRVEPGQQLMTIVSDEPWVVANYKETQLKNMKKGQKVEIKIDSFPNHKFEGTVLSFSPGSGSSFAILPSDNATGNFTKIVQRVPVKILFTPESLDGYEDRVTPGLSAVTNVHVLGEE